MKRFPMVLALLLAATQWPVRAGEEELEVNFQTGRRALEPDPLVLPQWRGEDGAAFAAGRPVNLGGGLWSEERYPLEAVPAAPFLPDTAGAADADFVRAVDLSALAQGPWPVASAAGPEAAELLRARQRTHTPIWRSLLAGLQILTSVFVFGSIWHTRRRQRRPRTFQFPETEPPTRLGGPHCGGSGAVLRW